MRLTLSKIHEELDELKRQGRKPRLIVCTKAQLFDFANETDPNRFRSAEGLSEIAGLKIVCVRRWPRDRFVLDERDATEFLDHRATYDRPVKAR